ncbi:glycosyltransferase [Hymenobacter sp. HSC-4F20]|nr:glycosyltransferase [Hymenobacter sp. HSC-4F20]
MRVLVGIGVVLTGHFLWWFSDKAHVGYAPLFWLLSVSLGFKLLRMLHEWYHYVQVSEPVAPAGPAPALTVDVLTTACPGEPRAMIEQTLRAMQQMRYPHTSYLCDEGDDPYLRQLCQQLGVVHVTRQVKVDAKAGNINHALQQACGQLCLVLDPDHVPAPDFLEQVVPYFADAQVGYVQVVQAYGNQAESLVARGAAEQTYHFYGPLMMGMHAYNTAQAIGANCTFRRTALDSIGGHAAGLTEDMHTAMRLHAQGWKSVYAPLIVSRGLVPSTLGAFYAQQLKWARGAFDLLLYVYPRLFARFSFRQQLHYATLPLYFLAGLITLIDIIVPIASLVLVEFPWHLSLPEFALHLSPVLAMSLLIRYNAQRWLREPQEAGLHVAGGILRTGSWWVYTLGLVYTLVGVRVPYIPTPKEGELHNEWKLSLPNLLLAAACLAAARYGHYLAQTPYALLMMSLALLNAGILLAAVLMAQHQLLAGIRRFFTSRPPIRRLLGWVERVAVGNATAFLPRLRTAAVQLAFLLFTTHTLLSVGVSVWAHQMTPSAAVIWAHTGVGPVRVGYSAPPATVWPTAASSGTLADAGAPATLVELRCPPGPSPWVEPATLRQLMTQGRIPLLSWPVPSAARLRPAPRQLATTIAPRPAGPRLLRPLIAAKTPTAYRAAWRQLVTQRRAAGDSTAAWVWTPPRPDSVAAYFPGAAYVDWVAADFSAEPPLSDVVLARRYRPLRLQLAERAELNSKPVLLLLAPHGTQPLQAQTRRFTQAYPEVKALLFSLPTPRQSKEVVLSY